MRKHYTSYLKLCTLLIVAAASMASCGLLDYDLEGNPERVAVTMHLDRDTMYVMTGDHFMLTPIFDPDTVNIEDLFYYTDDYDWGLDGSDYSDELEEGQRGNTIVVITPSTMIAQSPGWTTVYVQSVSARLRDSCAVCVLEPWELNVKTYPYETVIYANVTVNGEQPTPDMIVAAFCGNEVRDFAHNFEAYGTSFTIFRAGSEYRYTSDDEDPDFFDDEEEEDDNVPWTTQHEYISIRAYDPTNHRLYTTRTRILFDGESHGTPSNPLKIDLK